MEESLEQLPKNVPEELLKGFSVGSLDYPVKL